ncbi:MAG: response regulator [Bacteroidetes bacterium]|nr:MAG: response regulator [Bacteroidota bacterium]
MEKAIICVDDEKIILDALKTQLKERYGDNYIYELAESGEEGLEILDELLSDDIKTIVIISDWLMPNMKGDEFLIKVHNKHPDIIKIMLSGQANMKAVDKAKKYARINKFINKPWKNEQLFDAIESNL